MIFMAEKRCGKRFNLVFGAADGEAAEWFASQPDKGAYLKALILADKAEKEAAQLGGRETKEPAVFLAVRPVRP